MASKTINITELWDTVTSLNPLLQKITLPKMETLRYNWRKCYDLQPSVLYQPKICNLESGDAFCVIPIKNNYNDNNDNKDNNCSNDISGKNNNNSYQLIVLQVTVGEKHPIKANGLKVIFDSFPENIRKQITRKLIVFVTPLNGKLHSIQPIHGKGNKVMKNSLIRKDIRDFEQGVCRYSIENKPNSDSNNNDNDNNDNINNKKRKYISQSQLL
jgi:hypothetical protein